jgi:hypothetical protein
MEFIFYWQAFGPRIEEPVPAKYREPNLGRIHLDLTSQTPISREKIASDCFPILFQTKINSNVLDMDITYFRRENVGGVPSQDGTLNHCMSAVGTFNWGNLSRVLCSRKPIVSLRGRLFAISAFKLNFQGGVLAA